VSLKASLESLSKMTEARANVLDETIARQHAELSASLDEGTSALTKASAQLQKDTSGRLDAVQRSLTQSIEGWAEALTASLAAYRNLVEEGQVELDARLERIADATESRASAEAMSDLKASVDGAQERSMAGLDDLRAQLSDTSDRLDGVKELATAASVLGKRQVSERLQGATTAAYDQARLSRDQLAGAEEHIAAVTDLVSGLRKELAGGLARTEERMELQRRQVAEGFGITFEEIKSVASAAMSPTQLETMHRQLAVALFHQVSQALAEQGNVFRSLDTLVERLTGSSSRIEMVLERLRMELTAMRAYFAAGSSREGLDIGQGGLEPPPGARS